MSTWQSARVTTGGETSGNAVRIARGLALNREGQTLELSQETTLELVPTQAGDEPRTGHFDRCDDMPAGDVATGDKVAFD